MPRINYSCPQKLDKSKTERGGGSLQLQDKPATPTPNNSFSGLIRMPDTPSGNFEFLQYNRSIFMRDFLAGVQVSE